MTSCAQKYFNQFSMTTKNDKNSTEAPMKMILVKMRYQT